MVSSAAFASGTLERTPPIHLLVSLLERQLTGTLVLETQTGAKSALNFVRGVPNKLKAAEPVARLGTLLVEFGYLDEATCESSHAESTQAKCLHGQYLVQSGAIDTNILNRALRSQLLLKLQWFCGLPVATAYGFYERQDFLSRWAGDGVSVSPLLVLWDLIRSSSNPPGLSERTKRYESRVIVLDSRAILAAFGFETAERRLLNVLRDEPQTLQDLRALNLVTEPVLQRLLYVLSLTRHIGLAQDAERATPQRLLLTVEMESDFTAAAKTDSIADTIDYYAVTQRLLKFGEGREWKLIEKLAADIAAVILAEFKPQAVTVEVKKFIIQQARYVSVAIAKKL